MDYMNDENDNIYICTNIIMSKKSNLFSDATEREESYVLPPPDAVKISKICVFPVDNTDKEK